MLPGNNGIWYLSNHNLPQECVKNAIYSIINTLETPPVFFFELFFNYFGGFFDYLFFSIICKYDSGKGSV